MDALANIFNIKGKQVLITGACGYFGQYITKAFLSVGCDVVLFSRSEDLYVQVHQYRLDFPEYGVIGYAVDNYDRIKFKKDLQTVRVRHDIDVLINNAYDTSIRTGFNTKDGYLENSTYHQWLSAFESGIYWAVLTTQIIGGSFKEKEKGSIINIGSMYGLMSPDPRLYEETDAFNPPTYSTMKGGLLALTRYTASFWGKYGVRCNALMPGSFPNTESGGPNSVKSEEAFLKALRKKEKTALRRLGHPKELMGALIFLACDASSYMTGQTLVVDGGWTIR